MEVSMKRWLATLVVFALCTAVVRADVTIVQTTTVEGGMAAMAPGGIPSPTMTTRVKGMRSRVELDAGTMSVITITDLTTKQIIILRPDQKTATIASAVPAAVGPGTPARAPVTIGVDASVTATGKSQVIDGIKCDEYTFHTSMDLSGMTGGQMPPEAAAMMQGVKMLMAGGMWVAKDVPGAADFVAFQKASATSDMAAAAQGASGINIPGMDKLMKAMGSLDGMDYMTEMTMTVDGTGQVADMMKQLGAMKITTKTTSIKADALSDDLFKVPEGYTIVK
jgi:hypothetical protein